MKKYIKIIGILSILLSMSLVIVNPNYASKQTLTQDNTGTRYKEVTKNDDTIKEFVKQMSKKLKQFRDSNEKANPKININDADALYRMCTDPPKAMSKLEANGDILSSTQMQQLIDKLISKGWLKDSYEKIDVSNNSSSSSNSSKGDEVDDYWNETAKYWSASTWKSTVKDIKKGDYTGDKIVEKVYKRYKKEIEKIITDYEESALNYEIKEGETSELTDPTSDPNAYKAKPATSDKIGEIVGPILGVIRNIGIVVSVISLMIIGVKYMIGSAEERSIYKETLYPWFVGIVVLLAGSVIPSVIYNVMK